MQNNYQYLQNVLNNEKKQEKQILYLLLKQSAVVLAYYFAFPSTMKLYFFSNIKDYPKSNFGSSTEKYLCSSGTRALW